VPSLAGQRRQPAHERAADSQDVYVHAEILGGCRTGPARRLAESP
jgi:hypothetical protein